jgi:hypothetical protein
MGKMETCRVSISQAQTLSANSAEKAPPAQPFLQACNELLVAPCLFSPLYPKRMIFTPLKCAMGRSPGLCVQIL